MSPTIGGVSPNYNKKLIKKDGKNALEKSTNTGEEIKNLLVKSQNGDTDAQDTLKSSSFEYMSEENGQLRFESAIAFSDKSMQAFDKNNDKKVSTEEFGEMGNIVDQVGTKDGNITAAENTAYLIFKDSQENLDGVITPSEDEKASLMLKNNPNEALSNMQTIYNDKKLQETELKLQNQGIINFTNKSQEISKAFQPEINEQAGTNTLVSYANGEYQTEQDTKDKKNEANLKFDEFETEMLDEKTAIEKTANNIGNKCKEFVPDAENAVKVGLDTVREIDEQTAITPETETESTTSSNNANNIEEVKAANLASIKQQLQELLRLLFQLIIQQESQSRRGKEAIQDVINNIIELSKSVI